MIISQSKNSKALKSSEEDCYCFLGNVQLGKCCFTSFQEGFSIAMPKCNILKCQQNSEKNPMKLPFEIFSVSSPRGSLPACPVQQVQGPQCPSSAGRWFLSVAPPRENISVGIKELLCFIRLKSSQAVVHNGEQKKFKEPDKLFMVASLRPPHLLATTAAASSDVLCLILTRR